MEDKVEYKTKSDLEKMADALNNIAEAINRIANTTEVRNERQG